MNDPRQPVGNPFGFRFSMLAVCLVVLLPLVWYGSKGEGDRWRAAGLMERYLDGDHQTAIGELQAIVNRHPADQSLRATLVRWLLDDRQSEAALQQVLAIPEEFRRPQLLALYQECLQANGQSAEALAVFRELNPANSQRSRSERIQHLNALAYMQALDGSQLRLALKNSSRVVADIAAQWNAEFETDLSVANQVALAAVLVYRGSHRHSRPGQSINTDRFSTVILDILDRAVRRLELENTKTGLWQIPLTMNWPRQIFGLGEDAESASTGDESPPVARSAAGDLATMLTLRALVWQDLEQLELSFADRRRVIDLGFDPEKIAARWPPVSICAVHLASLAMTLDTRGCVLYKLEKLQMAVGDLNSAVMAQESLVAAGATGLPGVVVETADLRERRVLVQEQPQKTLAVLLFHRSWILRGLGLEQSAIADIARVRALGFAPGHQLF